MKILPLILTRSAAFSTRDLAVFRWPNDGWHLFDSFFGITDQIKILKTEINAMLGRAIQQEPSYVLKSRLSGFRADLFNGRKWRIERLKGVLKDRHPLFGPLEELRQKEEAALLVRAELERFYEEKLVLHRQHFLQLFFAQDEQLLKGLLLSSHSFYQRVVSYRQKPLATFRKKEKQTERSLLQYLSRMASKTTPFSTFTHIDLYDW
ncbi:MAG: lantibiotic dehydratase, partial [Bacteroidota bacterium]